MRIIAGGALFFLALVVISQQFSICELQEHAGLAMTRICYDYLGFTKPSSPTP